MSVIHIVDIGYYIGQRIVSIFVFIIILMAKATKIKREKIGVSIVDEVITESKAETIEIIETPAIVPHVTAVARQEASAPSNRVKVLNAHTGRIIAMAVQKAQAERLVKNNPNLKIEY